MTEAKAKNILLGADTRMTKNKQDIQILAVEDDQVDYMKLERALRKCDFNVSLERADTVAKAKDCLEKSTFQCIFLDYRLPDGTGLEFLSSHEYLAKKKNIVVIMLTGEDDISIAVEAMKQGAQDYIPKNSICSEILEIVINKAIETLALEQQITQYQAQIEELAFFDTLTGLPNRYVFEDRLQQLIRMAKRNSHNFMVGILDLDNFKTINDNLGHLAGDAVLKSVASRLASIIRDGDTIARFGGDEFVLLLPENDVPIDVEIFSKRILEAVEEPIHIADKELHISISIGLSSFPIHGRESDILIKRADEALYQVKKTETGPHWKIADITP